MLLSGWWINFYFQRTSTYENGILTLIKLFSYSWLFMADIFLEVWFYIYIYTFGYLTNLTERSSNWTINENFIEFLHIESELNSFKQIFLNLIFIHEWLEFLHSFLYFTNIIFRTEVFVSCLILDFCISTLKLKIEDNF